MIITHGNRILGLGNDPEKKDISNFQLMVQEKLPHEEFMQDRVQLSKHTLEEKVPLPNPAYSLR